MVPSQVPDEPRATSPAVVPDARAVKQLLDAHGIAFQYGLLAVVERLATTSLSPWRFEAAEFPVETQGHPTHIDFILSNPGDSVLLICECKRVDPGQTAWYFFSAPYTYRTNLRHPIICEDIHFDGNRSTHTDTVLRKALGVVISARHDVYHYAIERSGWKDHRKSVGSARQSIDDAATQVCRGMNGLVDHYARIRSQQRAARRIRLVPVIITTARLFRSGIDLRHTDLTEGVVTTDDLELQEVPWVFYQHNTSPGIKHSKSWTRDGSGDTITHDDLSEALDLSGALQSEFTRTIAIVTGAHFDEFLRAESFT
jgi:hypothetical protein